MRTITVISMISLDGVLQAPGGPDEDTSGGFTLGGWTAGFDDPEFQAHFAELMAPSDILLGRTTFDIFAGYWPQHAEFWPGINEVTKYAVSHTAAERSSDWSNTVFLSGVDDIRALKASGDAGLTVWGSGDLIQTLLENDLVDELVLVTYPVTLGSGKRLFDRGTIPAAFTVSDGAVTASGVVFARYTRAGDVVTGNVGPA
jgi:dihydrofolate reductase